MLISVFGLGYVGAVSCACLAERGHTVIGVDVSAAKVELMGQGKSPICEPGLDELLARHTKSGRLRATTDGSAAVNETELSLICVGTPSRADGAPDTTYVERVCEQIGRALAGKGGRHTVVVRSTSLPRAAENVFLPVLEAASGLKAGGGFGFAVHPEFLREGSAVKDFLQPPKIVIGTRDRLAAKAVEGLYDGIDAPRFVTSPAGACMVKYADNAFHATKVAFANEVGRLCKQAGVDGQEVMAIFCKDTKLNISPAYLKPAFAFGGSCLPKDLRAITHEAGTLGEPARLLRSILPSNDAHLEALLKLIEGTGAKSVGLFGLTFKTGTDDLRESAAMRIAERLLGAGYDLRIFEPQVTLEKLVGANKQYAQRGLPNISELLCATADETMAGADVLVVIDAKFDWSAARRKLKPAQKIIDTDGGGKALFAGDARYLGICW